MMNKIEFLLCIFFWNYFRIGLGVGLRVGLRVGIGLGRGYKIYIDLSN